MILIISSLLSVLWLSSPGVVNVANSQGQMTDIKVLENGNRDWQCASTEERERARNEIHQIANSTISAMTRHIYMYTCNGTPGWSRVAFINMTDTSYDCPTGLNLTSYSKRTCGASHTTRGGCSSTTFSVGGLPYSHVCGRIRGYQVGSTNAFFYSDRGIDSYYVSGVSLTHGGAGNRQHIWTFAAGISEVRSGILDEGCPCDRAAPSIVYSVVGNDYFCESGLHSEWNSNRRVLFYDDALWDGQNCTANSTCCQFNNPPWFIKNLPTATADDIELRICTPNFPSNADVPLELIELYVQ